MFDLIYKFTLFFSADTSVCPYNPTIKDQTF